MASVCIFDSIYWTCSKRSKGVLRRIISTTIKTVFIRRAVPVPAVTVTVTTAACVAFAVPHDKLVVTAAEASRADGS
jgi:hypothetical protein